jgi:hypothetical protein
VHMPDIMHLKYIISQGPGISGTPAGVCGTVGYTFLQHAYNRNR